MVITLDGAVQLIVDFIHDHIDVTGVHEYIFIRRDVRGVHMVEPAVADGAHRLPRVVRVGIRLEADDSVLDSRSNHVLRDDIVFQRDEPTVRGPRIEHVANGEVHASGRFKLVLVVGQIFHQLIEAVPVVNHPFELIALVIGEHVASRPFLTGHLARCHVFPRHPPFRLTRLSWLLLLP